MNLRQTVVAVIAILALAWAAARMVQSRRAARIGQGPPPGYSAVWRCRATGFSTNLAPEAVGALLTQGKFRPDPANPNVTLVACPDCGKVELEPATVTPAGVVSP